MLVFGANADIDGMGTGTINKTLRNPNPAGEKTPSADSGKYVTDFVSDKNLELYVNFDGESSTTATGQGFEAAAGNGSVSYDDGVFGNALTIKNGAYATVSGIELGSGSYTFSFWIKMESMQPDGSDPCIISTKDWNTGGNPGFLICTKTYYNKNADTRHPQVVGVLADGSSRSNCDAILPDDFTSGWVHVTVVVDKENKLMNTYFDFKLARSVAIADALLDQTITQTSGAYVDMLRIGQDLEANYDDVLNASIDELMVFNGALTADEIRALSAYYGLESAAFGN